MALTKAEKAFIKDKPDNLKKFYADQFEADREKEARRQPAIKLPYFIWLPEFKCKSYNEYKGSVNIRAIEAGMKETALERLSLAGVRGVMRVKEKRVIIFERIWPKGGQAMDKINYANGLKMMLDAVNMNGLIFDDKPKWIEDEYPQRKYTDPNEWGLKITIKEAK